MTSRLLTVSCLIVALCGSRAAHAQDAFEIQVYDAETAAPGGVGVELHVNNVLLGTTQASSSGELPTNHVTHLTLEPHVGLASWCELGGYLQGALRPDGSIDYGGVKLRFKMRLPRRVASGLIGLAVNFELSFVPKGYEPNVFGSEIRPVLDLRWKRLYFAINPIIDTDLGGAQAGRPQLQPAATITVDVAARTALGVEYYAAFGPITQVEPLASQAHRLFAVLDLARRISPKLEFDLNVGVGANLTGSGDRVIVKAIFGFGW